MAHAPWNPLFIAIYRLREVAGLGCKAGAESLLRAHPGLAAPEGR